MESLVHAQITVPLSHLILYIVVVTFCLLLSRVQLGLTVTFIFVFYLGYIHNYDMIMEMLDGRGLATILYFGSGIVIIGLSIISFFRKGDD